MYFEISLYREKLDNFFLSSSLLVGKEERLSGRVVFFFFLNCKHEKLYATASLASRYNNIGANCQMEEGGQMRGVSTNLSTTDTVKIAAKFAAAVPREILPDA